MTPIMLRNISLSFIRLLVGFLLIGAAYFVLGKWIEFGTHWSLIHLSIAGSLAAELIYQSYRYERSAISTISTKRGHVLLALRWIALTAIMWMLSQPVWSRMVDREILKEIVVILDDSASMDLIDDGQSASRQQLAEQALEASGLYEQLDGKVRIRTVRAARKVLGEGESEIEGWNQATDLTAALNTVIEQVPADQLGGVVLLSDGRHNRPNRIEDVARRFGILDAPIGVLAMGSETPPRDAAILSVQSPDAVYLGDRIRANVTLKFDGYRGKKTKVRLYQGDLMLEEREVAIPQDHHREEVKFRHTPDKNGIISYRIELDALQDERFENNNSWSFETAVTDARTNVLILESHPRWEFRYLRNLFYGRDKSIHLQYVLLNPDRIEGQSKQKIAASASRPFGEAQATQLPNYKNEWRKFDVIILGDLQPDALSEEQWTIIQDCVQQRGAMLVTIAGPRWMPHAHQSPTLESLLPVQYNHTTRTYFGSTKKDFQMTLTSEGRQHTITAQSDSRIENASIWSKFPRLRWRHPITGIKEGAEVLVMANPKPKSLGKTSKPRSIQELDRALENLAHKNKTEQENALLVTQQVGHGKVAMLLSDRSWRLREGVGDTHHHKFWGQLVRWGAGPNLRSGTDKVRLGTDQLTYSGDDPIEIIVRLRDKKLNPIKDRSLKAHIWKLKKKVATIPLSYVKNSNGLHRVIAPALAKIGTYHITIDGDEVDPKLTGNSSSSIRSVIRVIGATSPVELSETTLNLPLLDTIAELSGGRVILPADADLLPALFLSGDETRQELRETTLWDHWLVLLILLVTLTAEWSLRRKVGLP